MKFPCKKCGLCCKHLELIPELKNYDSGNGRCVYLLNNNLCAIYEHRPNICNVNKMYELVYSKQMSLKEYIQCNLKGCEVIRQEYGQCE